jgi:hypothetical protein
MKLGINTGIPYHHGNNKCKTRLTIYLHNWEHLGGLVTRSLPHGTVNVVDPQLQLTSFVNGQG